MTRIKTLWISLLGLLVASLLPSCASQRRAATAKSKQQPTEQTTDSPEPAVNPDVRIDRPVVMYGIPPMLRDK